MEGYFRTGALKVATPAVISVIVNEIKPYHGGNDALWGLHKTDIADKHILLIPVFSVSSLTGVTLRLGNLHMHDCTVAVAEGGQLRVASTNPDTVLELENQCQPCFSVLFAQGQPFSGEAVIARLRQLSQLITDCVNTIEKAFVASAGL